MHSAWYRANAVLTLASTVLTALFGFATFIDSFHKGDVYVVANVTRINSLRQEPCMEQYYSRRIAKEQCDRARLGIDLQVDLHDEFTWMTKQLFLYVTVDFDTPSNKVNQMVMWNHIITDHDHAALEGTGLDERFPFVVNCRGRAMRGRPFNLTVSWNIMPYIGVLRTRSQTFPGFRFPEEYTPKPETRQFGERSNRAPTAELAAEAAVHDEAGEVLSAEAAGQYDDEEDDSDWEDSVPADEEKLLRDDDIALKSAGHFQEHDEKQHRDEL